MSISKTAQGTWRVRVDYGRSVTGKRMRKSGTFPTKREAETAEHIWIEETRNRALLYSDMYFGDFAREVYMKDKKQRVRYSTYAKYERDLTKYILPYVGMMRLPDIRPIHIQDLIDRCPSWKVADNVRALMRQILNYAIRRGFLHDNVATLTYEMPKKRTHPDEHNGDWLTSFEAHKTFIESVEDPLFKTMCVLGFGLGLRKGEIFGLNWEDIDFEKRLVHIVRTYVYEEGAHKLMDPKTYESVRYIPMHKGVYEYLLNMYHTREEQGRSLKGPVMRNYRGHRASPTRSSRRFREYLLKHNLRLVTVLNMRHSFATACLNAGIDVTKVSKMLGHTSISTTVKRYIRFKPDDLVAEFDRLDL